MPKSKVLSEEELREKAKAYVGDDWNEHYGKPEWPYDYNFKHVHDAYLAGAREALKSGGVHSCSAKCLQPICVVRRECDALAAECVRLYGIAESMRIAFDAVHPQHPITNGCDPCIRDVYARDGLNLSPHEAVRRYQEEQKKVQAVIEVARQAVAAQRNMKDLSGPVHRIQRALEALDGPDRA